MLFNRKLSWVLKHESQRPVFFLSQKIDLPASFCFIIVDPGIPSAEGHKHDVFQEMT